MHALAPTQVKRPAASPQFKDYKYPIQTPTTDPEMEMLEALIETAEPPTYNEHGKAGSGGRKRKPKAPAASMSKKKKPDLGEDDADLEDCGDEVGEASGAEDAADGDPDEAELSPAAGCPGEAVLEGVLQAELPGEQAASSAGSAPTKKANKKKAEKVNKGASKKKKENGKGKETAEQGELPDEEKLALLSEQECLDLGGTKPPSHVTSNHVYSSAYKHCLKTVTSTEKAKENARRASALFVAYGLVLPDTTGKFRDKPRKPTTKKAKPHAADKSDARETPVEDGGCPDS